MKPPDKEKKGGGHFRFARVSRPGGGKALVSLGGRCLLLLNTTPQGEIISSRQVRAINVFSQAEAGKKTSVS